MQFLLGLEVWQGDGEIFLGQGKYGPKILRRFHMQDCRPVTMPLVIDQRKMDTSRSEQVDPSLYQQLIGSLMYLVNTWPDICFPVNSLSQFTVKPTRAPWVSTKHVLRYLRETKEYGQWYRQVDGVKLEDFINANQLRRSIDKKSHQDVHSVLDQQLFLGLVGRIYHLH